MKKLLLPFFAAGLLFIGVEAATTTPVTPREEKTPQGKTVLWYNALRSPFEVNGFPWRKSDSDVLRRTPDNIVVGIPQRLRSHTSGGAVRFATDAPVIYLRARMHFHIDPPHMARTGSGGFDLMLGCGTPQECFRPMPLPSRDEVLDTKPYLRTVKFRGKPQMRHFTLFLPLYTGVKSLEIGVDPGYQVHPPAPQKIKDPVCFYGSSITQGACASRPAFSYTTMLCRAIDAPQINMGFSGSAKGEESMARAIAGLKLSAFVLDYDHNAPTPKHLSDTHERFFRIVREAQPELPIIILSGPRAPSADARARRDIVKATFEHAVAAGDKNVYFVDGQDFFRGFSWYQISVDNIHPTDLGLYLMFKKILPVLKQALKL